MCYYIPSIAVWSLTVGTAAGAGEGADAASEQFYSPPTLWEMGMWRVARLMYLTQWKPRAEPMKTPFQGGQELAWFMAPRRWKEFGTWAAAEASTAAALTLPPLARSSGARPRTRLIAHCWAAASSTVGSRAAGAPLLHFGEWRFPAQGYIISNGDSWLYGLKGGSWHRKVIKRIDGVLMHTVQRCTLIFSDLFIQFSNSLMERRNVG